MTVQQVDDPVEDKLAEVLGIAFLPRRHPRPAWERALLDTGRRRELAGGGVAWAFGSGPTVLLVHGWEGRGAQLGSLVQRLLRAGLSPVVVDAPAHGDAAGEECDVLQFADALVDAANDAAVHGVVAHSLGGLATGFAVTNGMRVDRFALLAAPSSVEPQFARFARWRGLDAAHLPRLHAAVEARIGASLSALTLDHHTPQMDMPSVVIHDRNDTVVDVAAAERLASLLPDTTVHLTRGLGHRGVLHDPECLGWVEALLTSPGGAR